MALSMSACGGENETPRYITRTMTFWKKLLWIAVTLLGLGSIAILAMSRREQINALWIIIAGLCAFALISVLAIMIILLAVLALVVVQALAKSPWGVFTIAMTIPIALLMGAGLRSGLFNVSWITAFGIVGLFFAVWGGQFLGNFPALEGWFRHSDRWLAWAIMAYGFAASILPVWLLLTARGYLSTFLKIGTVAALAAAVVLIHPVLQMPALTKFIDGSGLVFAGL